MATPAAAPNADDTLAAFARAATGRQKSRTRSRSRRGTRSRSRKAESAKPTIRQRVQGAGRGALMRLVGSRPATIVLFSLVACGVLLAVRPPFLYDQPEDPLEARRFSWLRALCWCGAAVALITLASLKGSTLTAFLPVGNL
jgi:hypothetical protein